MYAIACVFFAIVCLTRWSEGRRAAWPVSDHAKLTRSRSTDSLNSISRLLFASSRVPTLTSVRQGSTRSAPLPLFMHGGVHHHHHEHHHDEQSRAGPGIGKPLASLHHNLFGKVLQPAMVQSFVAWSTIRRHMANKRALKQSPYQTKEGVRITWIGAVINLALAFFKAFAGVVGHSSAMVSDAAHSFSDLVSDVLTLATLHMAALPADADHPYGHGRFESLGSLGIAGLLVMAGCTFGATAYVDLRRPAVAPLGKIALAAAVASIASKELLFRATDSIGRKLNSQMLIANAWHHRSDAFSSIVALVGICGGLLGLPILDPIAGLLVAGMVTTMGIRIGIDALGQLTDTSDTLMADKLYAIVHGLPGVQCARQIRSRSMGGSYFVDMAIQVEPRLSASAAHKVGEEVRHAVLDKMPHVSEVLVHIDTAPHDISCPLQDASMRVARSHLDVEKQVRAEMMKLPELENVTNILVHYPHAGLSVDVNAQVKSNLRVKELALVADRAKQRLKAVAPDIGDVRLFVDVQSHA